MIIIASSAPKLTIHKNTTKSPPNTKPTTSEILSQMLFPLRPAFPYHLDIHISHLFPCHPPKYLLPSPYFLASQSAPLLHPLKQ